VTVKDNEATKLAIGAHSRSRRHRVFVQLPLCRKYLQSMSSSSMCRCPSIVVGVTLTREDSNGRRSAVSAHNFHPLSPRGFQC
jgi:hypothetical protein